MTVFFLKGEVHMTVGKERNVYTQTWVGNATRICLWTVVIAENESTWNSCVPTIQSCEVTKLNRVTISTWRFIVVSINKLTKRIYTGSEAAEPRAQ